MQRSCKTCRQRRRACDKARPTCGTCKKAGLLCEGYEQQDQKVFVNFDSKNLAGRKKRVLCEAIQQHRQQSNSQQVVLPTEQTSRTAVLLSNNDIRTSSLRVLDMTPRDFEDHVSTLWAYFEQNHTKTNCGWAPSLTPLKLQNRALDLALMSMASLRLSQHKNDKTMLVLSHTSYAQSLQIFRKLCANPDVRSSTLLPVITLVYALIEGCQEAPVALFTPGLISFNSHLRGCIHFVKQTGPKVFEDQGLHQAFKKIRELALLESLTVSEPSFLAEDKWMRDPWKSADKTRRDRLQDIMANLTVLAARPPKDTTPTAFPSPPRSRESTPKSTLARERLCQLEVRERELSQWASEWHASVSADHRSPDVPLDIYSKLDHEQIYLEVELWSNMLLLNLAYLQAADTAADADADFGDDHANSAHARRRQDAASLARRIKAALAMPLYTPRAQNGCLIEGQCRALFPAWTVLEHDKMDPHPATPDSSLHGSTGLGDRWERPVEDHADPRHLLGWWAAGSPPISFEIPA